MSTTLVIAHRGNSAATLENSLESIRGALSLQVDMIEIDIRMSRDRQLYVMHDKTTARTADTNIDIEEATSGEIGRIRLKNGEPVPTLTAVLDLVSGAAGLNLEIKSSGAGAATADYLRSSGYGGSVLLSSFKEEEVLAARRAAADLPSAMIFDDFKPRTVSAYKAQGYSVISLRKKTVTEKLIKVCHEQGIRVYVWTVDAERDMRTLIRWGVDGIYSNKPGVLKEIINKHQIANYK